MQKNLFFINLLGKAVSYVAINFAQFNKRSCDLHKYDVITTHTVGVRSTHIRDSANHSQVDFKCTNI